LIRNHSIFLLVVAFLISGHSMPAAGKCLLPERHGSLPAVAEDEGWVSPTSANTHQFAFSGSTPVHEWDGALNNGSRVDHLGGGVGGKLYSQDGTGNTRYPFYNSRGDIMAEFTSGGTMTWHGTHASSGLLQSQVGTRSSPYGANGKWEEPGGLINDGYRYRDRNTHTFITSDPAGFIDGPNTYNYVGHNPWSSWDPNGLQTTLIVPSGTADIGYIGPTSGSVNSTNSGGVSLLGVANLTPDQSIIFNDYLKDWFKGGTFGGDPTAEILRVMRMEGYLVDSRMEQAVRLDAYETQVGDVYRKNPVLINVVAGIADAATHMIPGSGPEGAGASDGSNSGFMLAVDAFRLFGGSLIALDPGSPRSFRNEFLPDFVAGYNSNYSYDQRTGAEIVMLVMPFVASKARPLLSEAFSGIKGSRLGEVLYPSFAGMPGYARGSVLNPFSLGKHGDMPVPRLGQQSHHGAMSAWMKNHFTGYDPNKAPAILMPEMNHRATFGVYNTWRAEMRTSMGGTFDWKNVSEVDMRALSERMFDAAEVPRGLLQDYWNSFEGMKGALGN
jgi:RHS repeat-associated protein